MVITSIVPVADWACGQATPLVERHGHRAHLLGDAIWVLGGYGRGVSAARRVSRWSPGEAEWTPHAPMERGRVFFGSGVVGEAIFAVGTSIERYDPPADAWTTVFDGEGLPRSHHVVAAYRGRLHVLGGLPERSSGHRVFDPATGALSRAPTPPGFARGDHLQILVVIGDRLHCVGGIGASSRGHAAFDGERWERRSPPPVPLSAKFAVTAVVDRSLFVFADAAGLRYDVDRDRWHEVAPLPDTLVMPAAVVRDGLIEVLGGRRMRGGYGRGCYDPARDCWEIRPRPN